MAGYLWSDPTPSNATSAVLSAPYKVDAANIGPVVDAILKFREAQNKAQQQSYSDMLKGISSGVRGGYKAYQQGQASGQADDAANAATYGALYPNDWQSAYTDPGRVPDYGGTSALAGIEAERKINPEAFMGEYQRMLMESKIQATDALAAQRDRAGTGSGYDSQLGPMTQTDDQGITWRQGAGGHWYPMKEPRTPNDEPPADFPDAYNSSAPPLVSVKDILNPDNATFRAKDPNNVYYGNRAVSNADVISLAKQYGVDRAQASPAPTQAPTQLAPGYGNKGVTMRAPDGTISTVDPALVDYYKQKGAVIVQ